MIWGLTGNIGQGKNTFAIAIARVMKMKNPQLEIYANFHLLKGLGQKISVDEFLAMQPSRNRKLMIIDEPYAWGLESRRSSGDLSIFLVNKALQSRKIGMDIIFITQLFSTIDRRFRQICQYIIFAYHANRERFKYYILTRRGARYRILKKELCEKEVFPYFDTMEIISLEQNEQENVTL